MRTCVELVEVLQGVVVGDSEVLELRGVVGFVEDHEDVAAVELVNLYKASELHSLVQVLRN